MNINSIPDFNLEEVYEKEMRPQISALMNKAQEIGMPIYVLACYKTDPKGAWLATSSRGREGWVPKEFYIIRAMVDGEIVNIVTVHKVEP